jgi:hypothetical protein
MSGYSVEVLADSPVGYWRLGEPSGGTAEDSTANNLDGTYQSGVTLAQAGAIFGDADTSASFDGTDDYVNLGSPTALRLTAAFTLEAWCFVPSGETQEAPLIAHVFGSGAVNYQLGFFDGSTTNLKPSVGFYNGSWNIANSATAISTNAWHHIVGTWDGTILRIYVDGTEMDTTTPGGSPTTDGNAFRIGSRWDATSPDKYKGRIDDVAIYGTTLSAARILVHYQIGTMGHYAFSSAFSSAFDRVSSGDASATPAAVAAVGAVPAPTVTGAATALPAAVAGIGAVPAPTAVGGGASTATPSTVAGVGTVPAPTVKGAATALPAVVASIGAVPAPTATGASSGTALPSTATGIGAVPAPTGKGNSTVSPARVIGIGAVPAPTAIGGFSNTVAPSTVAAIGRVPFPTTEGEGTGGGGGSPNGSQDFWSAVLAS